MFTDDYKEKKTEVQCSVFSGLNKGSERIVTINRFNGNITRTIDYIMDFVNQRTKHSIIKINDARINIDSYPARALFEGVINAVVHRDYYLDGTQIQVDMFKDRLEISSPGGTEHDARVLSFCYFKANKVSEIAEYLGISDSTYFRKQVLDNLEKHGYLEKSKVSRAAFYKTIPDMVNLE